MKSRRNFIKKSAIAGAGITMVPNFTFGITNKNKDDKLRVGLIGVGLRGTNHLNNVLQRADVLVTAICDIDPNRILIALDKIEEAGQKKPEVFGNGDLDYRNLLALKDVDAVIISTPWLWHTRMAKDSMKARKIYRVGSVSSKYDGRMLGFGKYP